MSERAEVVRLMWMTGLEVCAPPCKSRSILNCGQALWLRVSKLKHINAITHRHTFIPKAPLK